MIVSHPGQGISAHSCVEEIMQQIKRRELCQLRLTHISYSKVTAAHSQPSLSHFAMRPSHHIQMCNIPFDVAG